MDDFDEQEYKKKKMLEAMAKLKEEREFKRSSDEMARRAGPDKSKNIAKGSLDKDTLVARGGMSGKDMTPSKTVVGKTDNLTPDMSKQSIISGDDFLSKQREAEKSSLMRRFKKAADMGDKKTMEKLKDEAMGFAKKFKKIGKTGLKSIPLIGGLASLAMSENASASDVIPGLDMADSAGPRPGSLAYKMESGQKLSPEEQMELNRTRQKPTEEQLRSAEEKRRLRREALAKLSKPQY